MKYGLWFALWTLTGISLGCGGSARYAAAKSYDGAATEAAPPAPGEDYDDVQEEAEYAFEDEVLAGELIKSDAPSGSGNGASEIVVQRPAPSQSPQQNIDEKPNSKADTQIAAPMVMYSGFLRLRVKRLLDAMDEITKLTEERGGYVGSMTERVIVVRIPKGDFESAMAAFRAIGELLDRRVESLDVTEQFTDLRGRLAVAKEARERLLRLLEEVKDVTQRLRIMQEIKRLTEQIETIQARLDALKNLVDYFTITIELVPVLENTGVQTQRSPFPWVQALSAHSVSIYDGKDVISMTLPKHFVLFDEADTYRAQAADTTIIRAGVVENDPLGDNTFWSDAVHFEMEGRREISVASGTAGKLSYRLYRSDDLTPRYYLIAVHAAGEELYVVEVFYPTESSYSDHHESVIAALETFEVK